MNALHRSNFPIIDQMVTLHEELNPDHDVRDMVRVGLGYVFSICSCGERWSVDDSTLPVVVQSDDFWL